jgi:cytidylate kinase
VEPLPPNGLDLGPTLDSPRHGFQGDRGSPARQPTVPRHLTIAISREAGGRGGTIGRRVGRLLGWQVYDQELLEYMAQEGATRQNILDPLPPEAARWCEERARDLAVQRAPGQNPHLVNLAKVVLALAAEGGVVLIGRGANMILPRASTLSVRIIAPLPDRIAYMSQWLRLTVEEAAERVRLRDSRRAEFMQTHFQCQPGDPYQYDLLLNSSFLGEELCADLIVQAARAKQQPLEPQMNADEHG